MRNPATLFEDIDQQDLIVFNLVRGCELVIDIAAIVMRAKRFKGKYTATEKFDRLETEGIIDAKLAANMRTMAAFRNIAVHEYQELDINIVKSIVTKHLGELTLFADICLAELAELEMDDRNNGGV